MQQCWLLSVGEDCAGTTGSQAAAESLGSTGLEPEVDPTADRAHDKIGRSDHRKVAPHTSAELEHPAKQACLLEGARI